MWRSRFICQSYFLIVIVLFATNLAVPLTGDQMDVEQGYGGQPVFMQQPGVAVANDNVDLVRKILVGAYILVLIINFHFLVIPLCRE